MKILLLLSLMAFGRAETPKTLSDFSMKNIDGQNVQLKDYKGKVVMIVNTASKCGYTKQYDPLEKLYQQYKDKGFVILAFPSNDFLSQEPGTDKEIKAFCQTKFGITFPLFSKIVVKGDDKNDLYKWLTTTAPEKGEVSWNFEKFLIDKNGNLAARFPPKEDPLSPKIKKAVESLL